MKAINKALVQFHAQLKPIQKDASNPFFKSDYLTLSGILDAIREPLAKNGLAIAQPIRVDGDKNILATRLIHESGEEILSEMILPSLADPQKFGSLITYYKRYQLQALLGISASDEDDDANSVSQPQQRPASSAPSKPTGAEFPATDAQLGLIDSLCKRLGEKNPGVTTSRQASEQIQRLKALEAKLPR